MKNENFQVSVIVPAFNAAENIEACVRSIQAQTYSPCEIIVVNDASTDNTAEITAELNVKLINMKRNGGAGAARNAGVEVAQGDIVAFTDSDCVAPSSWVEHIVTEFEADPELGVVGGLYHPNNEVSSSVDLLCFFEEEYFWHISSLYSSEAFPPGGNIAMLKEVLKKGSSGLEIMLLKGIASGEDTLVCSELKKISKLKFLDSLFVHHRSPNHWRSYFRRHINRGLSRATLMANRLTVKSDITVEAYGGTSIIFSSMFLALFLISLAVIPFYLEEGVVAAGLFLLLHVQLSQSFFSFAKKRFSEIFSKKKLTLFQSGKVRLLLLVRLFCWICGFAKGFLKHWLFKLKTWLNIFFSVVHFWIPGRISRLFYFVTSKCNARCEFCFNLDNVVNWEERKSEELNLEEIEKVADRFGRLPYITLSGGEPFIRKDLTEVIRIFHERAKTQWVTIPTNGAITENTVKRVKEILQQCPGMFLTVQVSIDSLFEGHDNSRKMPGGFVAMVETLKELAKVRKNFKNLRIQINTCFDDFNVNQIKQIINYCKTHLEYDQQLFYLIREAGELITKGNNHLIPKFIDTLLANEEREWRDNRKTIWHRVVRVLQGLTYKDLVEIKLNEKFIRPCFATEKFVTLYDDGAVSPCEVLEDRMKLGNIKDYDYDFYKLQKLTKMKDLYSKEIVEGKCNCEWQCALPMNMLYDPSVYFRILKGLTSPSKIVQSVSQEVYGEAK